MVSLTFDEFHAIRSRQRATAEAEAAAAASAKASDNDTPGGTLSSGKSVGSTKAAEDRSSSRSSPSRSPGSSREGSDDNNEIAPTSGSVSELRFPRTSVSKVFFHFCSISPTCTDGLMAWPYQRAQAFVLLTSSRLPSTFTIKVYSSRYTVHREGPNDGPPILSDLHANKLQAYPENGPIVCLSHINTAVELIPFNIRYTLYVADFLGSVSISRSISVPVSKRVTLEQPHRELSENVSYGVRNPIQHGVFKPKPKGVNYLQ